MPTPTARAAPTAKQAITALLAFGIPLTVLGWWLFLASVLASPPAVLMSGEHAMLLTMGLGLTALGAFGLWAVREPRSDVFKASVISFTVLAAPFALVFVPIGGAALGAGLLQAAGFERCASPELERAYATGTGRNRVVPTVLVHPRDGGCAGLLAQRGRHR